MRQVLNHTSGLYDYMKGQGWSTNRWRGDERFATYSPGQLLAEAFRHEPYFAPGTDFRYSNTNYIVASRLIEESRAGRPAEWSSTGSFGRSRSRNLLPGCDANMLEPAVRATATLDDSATADATAQNVSLDSAAGETVSTAHDLQGFFDALLGGGLISEESLAQIRTTVPMGIGLHYGRSLTTLRAPGKSDGFIFSRPPPQRAA